MTIRNIAELTKQVETLFKRNLSRWWFRGHEVATYKLLAGWPTLCATQLRLPLDKSEGVVKDKDLLCSAEHRVFRQRLRTKTLEISR